MNDQQIEFVKNQIKDLGFTGEENDAVIWYFNNISQHMSKQSYPRNTTVLDQFFVNVNANYRNQNLTLKEKRDVFLGLLSQIYYRFYKDEADTDKEDND